MEAGHNIAVCTPTGKAAKRVYEATGIRARTIHALLEYTHPGDPDPRTGKPSVVSVPRRFPENPLDANIIIADEYAMVNRALHRSLVQAIPHGGRLLVFGDINQLPPIEESKIDAQLGSPFKMLMEKFPSVRLDKIHRQGAGSGIVDNSRRILLGQSPMRKDDFDILVSDDPVKHLGIILRRYEEEKQWCGRGDGGAGPAGRLDWPGQRRAIDPVPKDRTPGSRRRGIDGGRRHRSVASSPSLRWPLPEAGEDENAAGVALRPTAAVESPWARAPTGRLMV